MKKQINNTIELNAAGLIVTTLKATSLALIAFATILLFLNNQNFDGLYKNNQQTFEQKNTTINNLEKANCDVEPNKQDTECETSVETETDTLKADLFEQFDGQPNKFIRQEFL